MVNEVSAKKGYNVYTNDDRKDAAVAFVIHGNAKDVARICNLPERTVYNWIKADWWPKFLDEAKREHQDLIEGRLSDITERATQALVDRIENGDIVPKYNPATKEIEYLRVPVKGKELGQIVEKLGNQLRVIRNQPTKLTAEVKFDANKLAKQFAEAAEQNRERIVSEQ